ncbi:MAG: TldD/PmbA family protein [Clostridia bacterium]|nr:TldD/PmbA family protein [Clostridia bacterium]
MINRKTAEQVLSRALTTGGDFAEIFFEDTRKNTLGMIDGKIDTATTRRTHGAGIRIYQGLNSVYVYTNDTDLPGLMRAAQQAADAVGRASAERSVNLVGSVPRNIHEYRALPCDVPGQRRAKVVRDAYEAARAESAEIAQVRVLLNDQTSEVGIYNSDGLMVQDQRVYTRLTANAVASNGTENQTGFSGPGMLRGFELFDGIVDPAATGKLAAEIAVRMLHADACPAGVMPVVIDGGFGGVLFHEACGHSLEATAVAFGNSEFCGKLGQPVASPIVTAIDDGTMPNEWGSSNVDDEGTPTTRLVLIENGILKNYMIDRLNARRMGMPVTGSGRRESYAYAPTSRMRNTYIAPGSDDEGEIIASMGDGLYARSMGGGSVNPVTGEFNFAVMEGYLVKDGKIDRPVRGATLIGRGSDILLNIDRVGCRMWMAPGYCGSASGSVPTNVGQPMIRIKKLTVGGR